MSKVKSNYWRTTHSFGVRFPNTVKETFSIDKEAGNYYWEKALNKDTSNIKFAWKRVDGFIPDQAISKSVKKVIGHQEINCHIIFDVQMDFLKKAQFVPGVNTIEAPNSINITAWYPVTVLIVV